MLLPQFIVLLVLVSLPREMLGDKSAAASPNAGWWLASLWLGHLLIAAVAWVRGRRAVRALNQTTDSTRITHGIDNLLFYLRWISIAFTAAHVFETGMPETLIAWQQHTRIIRYVPMLPEAALLLPAMACWMIFWVATYSIERAARQRSLAYQLATARPVHEMPSLAAYLRMQVRHNFAPLLLMILLSPAGWLIDRISARSQNAGTAVSLAGTALVIVFLPALLIRLWSTRPLTGALRERLEGVARTYRLGFRNILLWRTHHLVFNAAIVGWVPRARYFLMTDSLLEAFTDRQLEAVFAHEVGHGVHHHIPWHMVNFISCFCLAFGLTAITAHFFPVLNAHDDWASALALGLTVLTFVGIAIPLVAPLFEYQADLFACRHMAASLRKEPGSPAYADCGSFPDESLPPELANALPSAPTAAETMTLAQYLAGEYPPERDAPRASQKFTTHAASPIAIPAPALKDSIDQQGAEVFVSALSSIVESAHRARDRRGWMHPSVNRRVDLQRQLAANREAQNGFARLMWRLRAAMVASLILAAGIAAVGYFIAPQVQSAAASPSSTQP